MQLAKGIARRHGFLAVERLRAGHRVVKHVSNKVAGPGKQTRGSTGLGHPEECLKIIAATALIRPAASGPISHSRRKKQEQLPRASYFP